MTTPEFPVPPAPQPPAPQPPRRRWGLILFIALVGALLVGAILIMAGMAALMKGGTVTVKPNSTLVLSLDAQLQEVPPNPIATELFGAKALQMVEVHQALKRAAKDDRIKSLLIQAGWGPMGFGKMQELRSEIEAFKKSGKPVYAFFEDCGNGGYYLASAADKVYAPPSAVLLLTGLYAEVPFYRGGLENLKIEPQFFHIGDYKSYSDTFMRKDMSDAHRQAMDALLDGLYGQLVKGVAEGRKLTEEQVMGAVDHAMLSGADLKELKLVDDLWYFDQVEAALQKINGSSDQWARIEMDAYIKDRRADLGGSGKTVGVIVASGSIISGEADGSSGNVGSDSLVKWLRKAGRDQDIKAVVLRVDSPGGSGLASDVMWRQVALLRKSKPVVVSMSDVAASGGYYISMGADGIVAEPGTITGSIGVLTGKFITKGLWDWTGVNFVTMKRGANADLLSSYNRWTPEQEQIIFRQMESFYKDFVTKAAEGRGKSYDEIHKVAQGRVWTGEDALKLGLVDRLGGLNEAILLAKEKAKIGKDETVRLVVWPRPQTLMEAFLKADLQEAKAYLADSQLPPQVREITATLQMLAPMANEPYLALMPEKIIVK